MRVAIFPGTFDPFTLGHMDILKRSLSLFDKIIVGVGINNQKKTMFSIDERVEFIKNCFKKNSKISVQSYSGLTIEFCKKVGATFIVRHFNYISETDAIDHNGYVVGSKLSLIHI